MDYSQSHVETSVEYLEVMHKKAMEKASIKVIRETHCKEREEIGLKFLQITSLQMNGHFNVQLLKVQE
jgi:hypothetical protein